MLGSNYGEKVSWSKKGKLMKLFKVRVKEPDIEWGAIDDSIVKAHQHSAGAVGKEFKALGKAVVVTLPGFTAHDSRKAQFPGRK